MGETLEELAAAAAAGDADALTMLIGEIQHPVYGLALRFLGDPHDAQDATQEILLRVTTRLGSFEGRSKFMTWTYTIATRMLLRTKQGKTEALVIGPERFGQILDAGLSDSDPTVEHAEYDQLVTEVRISCTYGMLLCLSRPLRAAYILGDVLGLPDTAGAEVCDIKPPAAFARAADELDDLVAIGSLYQSDQFAAPATVWTGIQKAFPNLAGPGAV